MLITQSIAFFVIAGLCEIGGGYLIWARMKHGRSAWWAVAGAAIVVLYGVIATFQPSNFGRVYAAYGGAFIVMAILWGWGVDRVGRGPGPAGPL